MTTKKDNSPKPSVNKPINNSLVGSGGLRPQPPPPLQPSATNTSGNKKK